MKYNRNEIALGRPSRIFFSISCLIMYFNNVVCKHNDNLYGIYTIQLSRLGNTILKCYAYKNWCFDAFTSSIVNYSFNDSNIPASSAYRVYISKLIRYSRVCGQCGYF